MTDINPPSTEIVDLHSPCIHEKSQCNFLALPFLCQKIVAQVLKSL